MEEGFGLKDTVFCMTSQGIRIVILSLAAVVGLRAESGTTSIRYTGAPADGGQNCSMCHSTYGAANSDSRGSVTIDATQYNPGVMQTLHITVAHPLASRWGFQLTARAVSDETQEAGTFAPVDNQVQVRCDDGTQYGSPAPCNGAREFAEHVMAPFTATGAGYTFAVNWTPPPSEIGQIQMFVAGVAADGDGTDAGDRVYTAVNTLTATGACSLTKAPTVQTAVNGASFLPAFSSNAMLSVFGFDFQVAGSSREVGAGDIVNGAFPTQLGCVSVLINGQAAPISYVQQDQINLQTPTLSGTGPVSLVVVLNPGKPNEIRSDMATLTSVQPFAPAFFTSGGTSTVAAQFVSNSVVTLYGTGFGATSPPVAAGQIDTGVASTVDSVSVTIGGLPATVLYAGLSPGSISGLYQINVQIPAGLPSGPAEVIATIGGIQSQPGVTITIPEWYRR